jgi:hypothetical protein
VRITGIVAIAALSTGCVQFEVARFARISVAPTRGTHAHERTAPAVGRSCVTIVAVVPVTPMPNIGDAVADISGETGSLQNAVVRYELRYVPFVGGRSCYVVEGEPG